MHQAFDRHRPEAQHVGDPHDVLAQPRHVCPRQHASSVARLCSWRAPFPVTGSVRVEDLCRAAAREMDECGTAKSVIALQWNNEKQTALGILREKQNIVKRANTEQAMEQTASMTQKRHT